MIYMEFWAEILFHDSSFNTLSIPLDQKIELEKNDFKNWTLLPLFTLKP